MKKKFGFMILLLTLIVPTVIHTRTMSDFCSVSPFATRTVPPNITIILDNSSGMLSPAYPLTDHYDSSSPSSYSGYFDPHGDYCVRAGLFYETSGPCQAGEKGPYPGALLNWATMSKYDLLMYTLTGGLGTPAPDSDDLKGESLNNGWTKTTPRYPQCDFIMSDDSLSITGAGCALQNPAAKVLLHKGRKEGGILSRLVDKNRDGIRDTFAPRIAIMSYQSLQNDVTMLHCITGADTLHALYEAIAGAVPDEMNAQGIFGMAIVRAVEYYKNICAVCNSCTDPIDSAPCRKNFVIGLSGGDAADILFPYSEQYLYEEIRKAHTGDLRGDRDGTQVIQFFNISVFSSATGKDILKGFSKYGGFADANGNRLPDLNTEWDRNGDGLPDTYFEAADPASIRSSLERAFSDISARVASGTGVSLISDGGGGAGGIVDAHFLPEQQEGTGKVFWTGYMQSIWVDPYNNIREDSVHDYKLILNQDKIVKYFFDEGSSETKAALFTTGSDGRGGTFSGCSNPEVRASAHLNTLWEAGRSLALQDPSARTLFTAKRILRGDTVAYAFPETPFPAFHTQMNSTLLNALNPDTLYTADSIIRYIRGECLESGVSGDSACGGGNNYVFRDRRLTVNGTTRVWKLGDIMNSTPKVFSGTPLNAYHVDYSDKTYYDYVADNRYRNKSSVVFAGANDGMLHAFQGGYLQNKGLTGGIKALLKSLFSSGDDEHARLGEEIWAYIPFNAFPYLKYLSDPDYCHINYSDLAIKVYDVSLNGGPGAAKDLHSWKTILLGGMRFGGACGTGGDPAEPPPGVAADVGFSSYFALDVTVPEKPVPLWEFSDDDMGYATSAPAIVRTGNRLDNGAWYVVFGSGSKVLPGEGNDIGRSTPGYIYILNLGTGDLVKKITLDHPAIVGDMLAIDADHDYETEKIYFGTSYQSGTAWMGRVMSLDVPEVLGIPGLNIAWNPSFGRTLFSGSYPFTASPEAAQDLKGGTWVYAGSGKYFSDVDEADASQQIVLGVRDKNEPVTEAALYDATDVLTSGDVTGTGRVCAYDPMSNSFRLRDVVTSLKPTSLMLTETNPGWKIYLPDRERVISRPAAIGGLLDFLAYRPDSDPCAYGGESYLYSVNYATGQAPARIAIRSPDITSGTSGNVTVHKSVFLGAGAPPAADAIVVERPQDGEGDVQKHIQLATGSIAEAKNNPLFSVASKIVHWLKK